MKVTKKKLNLPEGQVEADVSIFEVEDLLSLKFIYESWHEVSKTLKDLGARGFNIPEGLTETSVCIYKSWYRVNNSQIGKAKTSFDAYDPNAEVNNNRIQIKAGSIENDLTSFGPRSVWDRIYFADFYNDGKWDGTVYLYELNTEDIKGHSVNAKQVFSDQQIEGRRPRFSIKKDLIAKGKYKSKEVFNINDLVVNEETYERC